MSRLATEKTPCLEIAYPAVVVLRQLQNGLWQVQRESDGKPFGPPMTKERAEHFHERLERSKRFVPRTKTQGERSITPGAPDPIP